MTTFNKLTKANKLTLAGEIIGKTNEEFAKELQTLLYEEAERIERANERSRGRRTLSKAQKERAKVVEQLREVLADIEPTEYYDSVGLVALIDLDYTPQRAIHVARDLVSEEVLQEVGDQKFADGKERKAYTLAEVENIEDLVPYDQED